MGSRGGRQRRRRDRRENSPVPVHNPASDAGTPGTGETNGGLAGRPRIRSAGLRLLPALILSVLAYLPVRAWHQDGILALADGFLSRYADLGLVLLEAGDSIEAVAARHPRPRLATCTRAELDLYLAPIVLLVALLGAFAPATRRAIGRAAFSLALLLALQPLPLSAAVRITARRAELGDARAWAWLEAPLAHLGFVLAAGLWFWALGRERLTAADRGD